MKKLVLLSVTLLSLTTFANFDSANSNTMMMKEKHSQETMVKLHKEEHAHNHEHEHEIEDFVVYNFHNEKGQPHSHMLVIVEENEAFVRKDGVEYELERVISGSGDMFKSKDGTIIVGIKAKSAYIDINGKMITYFLIGRASTSYAKHLEHDHK